MSTNRMSINRRTLLLAGGATLALPTIARGQSTLPNSPIRVVVPYAAGGTTDITGRMVAQELSQLLNRNFFVENRPGGATMIGTDVVARAKPDGTTFFIGGTSMVISPILTKSTFDPRKDMSPVGQILEGPLLFVANNSFGPKTIAEIIAEAKAKPGSLNISHPGAGSANHIALELFTRMAGIQVALVPFTGNAPSLSAVVGGHVQLALDAVLSARELVDAKQIRAIAVSGKERFPTLPDVPTVHESGLPGFDLTFWSCVMAPAQTPQPMIDEVSAALRTMLGKPEVVQRLRSFGTEPKPGTPADMAALIVAHRERMEPVIREANVKIE